MKGEHDTWFRCPHSLVVSVSMPGKVIIYGGKGGLGCVVVDTFKSAGYWVMSVDIVANTGADANVLVSLDAGWGDQEQQVCGAVSAALRVR